LQDAPFRRGVGKAKNQLITNQLRQLETSNGKALALGEARCCSAIRRESTLTSSDCKPSQAADIQRVMKKYFADTNRLVLYYLPEASKKSGEGK
jgi:hypothetical protein